MQPTVFPTLITEEKMLSLGVTACAAISTREVVFSSEVRDICAGGSCRRYGTTWACPPAVGSFDDCRNRILSYDTALIFAARYELEDSFDYEGMVQAHGDFKALCDRIWEHLEPPYLMLGNEGCIRCGMCTYPTEPCRFPEKLFPSLEGYGVLVGQTAKKAGIPYHFGPNTVAYFGMICYS